MTEVMVQWDESEPSAGAIARVSAVASEETLERPTRDVVTLYGTPTPESLALALAAAVEVRKAGEHPSATGEFEITSGAGAIGGVAFRDRRTGEVIKRELSIPLTVLTETAQELLAEGGQGIRRLLAGLLMPDWPEGTRRALTLQMAPAGTPRPSADTLDALREADAENFSDAE